MKATRTSWRVWAMGVSLGLMVGAACSSASSSPGGSTAGDYDAGNPDADAGMGLTCAHLLSCDQPCSGDACTNACYAEATGHAQGVFDALTQCINDQCSSAPGGPCASSSSAQCSSCNTAAATGACISILLACESDNQIGPADPDGGGAVPYDAGLPADSGTGVSCGAVVSCQQACAQGDPKCESACLDKGTATAQALEEALANCISTACPTLDGGPCATAGAACSGCEQQASFGACGAAFTACQNDTSAADGGSTEPVALHGGKVNLLVSGLDQPQVVLIQNGKLYFSEITQTGPVLDVSTSGGVVTTISPSQSFPMGLSIDADNLYVWNSGTFSNQTEVNNGDGTVVQLALSGGAATTLATKLVVAYGAPYLNAVANDAKNVYWVSGGPGTPGAINVAPIGGGTAAKVLYGGQTFPEAVVTDGTNLYWSNWGTFDAQGNYNGDGALLKAPVAGGATVTLASNQAAPAALAFDATNVYWTNIGHLTSGGLAAPGTGSVMQVAIAGGSPVTLASSQNIPLGIAVSGKTVYWAEFTLSSPGNIDSVPVGGGEVTTLVTNVKDPFGIAVAGGAIYWSDNIPSGAGSGALFSLTP